MSIGKETGEESLGRRADMRLSQDLGKIIYRYNEPNHNKLGLSSLYCAAHKLNRFTDTHFDARLLN